MARKWTQAIWNKTQCREIEKRDMKTLRDKSACLVLLQIKMVFDVNGFYR